MASPLKLLFTVVFFCFFAQGRGQPCDLSSILVNQVNTGLKFGFDKVFEVEVKNQCPCSVTYVLLSSLGWFASSSPVDPKSFRLVDGGYLINDGNPIPSSQSFKFRYSWDRAYQMAPRSFNLAC